MIPAANIFISTHLILLHPLRPSPALCLDVEWLVLNVILENFPQVIIIVISLHISGLLHRVFCLNCMAILYWKEINILLYCSIIYYYIYYFAYPKKVSESGFHLGIYPPLHVMLLIGEGSLDENIFNLLEVFFILVKSILECSGTRKGHPSVRHLNLHFGRKGHNEQWLILFIFRSTLEHVDCHLIYRCYCPLSLHQGYPMKFVMSRG